MHEVRGRVWVRRLWASIVGLFSSILIMASVGAAYQWIALRRDRRQNPMPGRLVDVGGYKCSFTALDKAHRPLSSKLGWETHGSDGTKSSRWLPSSRVCAHMTEQGWAGVIRARDLAR